MLGAGRVAGHQLRSAARRQKGIIILFLLSLNLASSKVASLRVLVLRRRATHQKNPFFEARLKVEWNRAESKYGRK